MTNELVKILEAALKHHKASNLHFSQYQETGDKCFMIDCRAEDDIARGLLEAYGIITGRKIYLCEIEAELANPMLN